LLKLLSIGYFEMLGHRTGLPGSVNRAEVSEEQECDSDFFFGVPESEMKRIVTVYDGKENYNFENMNKACYRRTAAHRFSGPKRSGTRFSSGGLGGSEGFCDFHNRICIGYTCAISATATGKPWDLRGDIYRAVGLRTRYTSSDPAGSPQ
jgi:hypothetical protein